MHKKIFQRIHKLGKQKDIAEMTGISYQRVRKICSRADVSPTRDELIKLQKVFEKEVSGIDQDFRFLLN